jgi:3-oxoacyl-[acyl-carrier-protein] synthase-3
MNPKARIIATANYLPEKRLTNTDLEAIVDTTDEWIYSRTGMKERRIAATEESAADMGYLAAKKLLEKEGILTQEIDMIIVATMTPDHPTPSTAALIQGKLGASRIPAFDISAACSGYIYALAVARAFIESSMAKRILFVATEKMSSLLDYTDRSTCILFGDGATAALITNEGPGLLIEATHLGAEGSLAPLLHIPAGGSRMPTTVETCKEGLHYLKMDGTTLFKHAVNEMIRATEEALRQINLPPNQLSWLVPHQANIRIIQAIAKRIDLPEERIYLTIDKYGNTSASSIGIALHELLEGHSLPSGAYIALTAFGAGLTWGSAILKKI